MKIGTVIALIAGFASTAAGQTSPQGQWEPTFNFGDASHPNVPAVSLVHVFDGFEGKIFAQTQVIPSGPCIAGYARLWTPPAMGSSSGDPGTFEGVPYCGTYIFCGGQCSLADGRALFVAGGIGEFPHAAADLLDPQIPPSSGVWNNPCNPPDMWTGRWYPTTTMLPDGKVLVVGGVDHHRHA